MSRPRLYDAPVNIRVSLPSSLVARLDQLTWDPVYSKPGYGIRSLLITDLLRKFLDTAALGAEITQLFPPDSSLPDTLRDAIAKYRMDTDDQVISL